MRKKIKIKVIGKLFDGESHYIDKTYIGWINNDLKVGESFEVYKYRSDTETSYIFRTIKSINHQVIRTILWILKYEFIDDEEN